jgi:hypothetical protein
MDKHQHQLRRLKLAFQTTDRTSIILGTIVAVFLATSPYLFYLYEYVPDTPVWDTFLFTYESQGYEDVQTTMWILTGKAIPLLFLTIWFFTCRQWWYHAILVPITMYTYQITALFNQDTKFIDEFQLLYLVPIMAIVIPSIYLVRARMFNKLNDANKSFEELEEEFMIKPTSVWGKVRQYF